MRLNSTRDAFNEKEICPARVMTLADHFLLCPNECLQETGACLQNCPGLHPNHSCPLRWTSLKAMSFPMECLSSFSGCLAWSLREQSQGLPCAHYVPSWISAHGDSLLQKLTEVKSTWDLEPGAITYQLHALATLTLPRWLSTLGG